MSELPSERLLLDALGVLEGLRLPHMVMGGFAVRAWGIPRPTYDADVAVAANEGGLAQLFDALERAGFDVPEIHRKGFLDTVGGMEKLKATRIAHGSVWDVDLFLVRGAHLISALERRRTVALGGRSVPVMAPEDVVLLKLVANRRKDQLDVEEILRITRDLDLAYVRVWAERLNVSDRLLGFLPEAGHRPTDAPSNP